MHAVFVEIGAGYAVYVVQYIFYDTYGPLFTGDRVRLGDEYMGRLLIQCSLSPCRQNDGLTSS